MSVSDARGVAAVAAARCGHRRRCESERRRWQREQEGDRPGAEARPRHAGWARILVMVCCEPVAGELEAAQRDHPPLAVDHVRLRNPCRAEALHEVSAHVPDHRIGDAVLLDELRGVARVVEIGDPEHGRVVLEQLALLLLENRRFRHARPAPGREHVDHDDLAAEVGQALVARRAQDRQLHAGAGGRRVVAAGDLRVDRRARPLMRDAEREERQQRDRDGQGDGGDREAAHDGRVIREFAGGIAAPSASLQRALLARGLIRRTIHGWFATFVSRRSQDRRWS